MKKKYLLHSRKMSELCLREREKKTNILIQKKTLMKKPFLARAAYGSQEQKK